MTISEKFMIGIDFGTTFSAVAWALASDPRNVHIVTEWPTSGPLVGIKVPSEVAYPDSASSSTTVAWGYDINPGSPKIKWFKLGLEPTSSDEKLALLEDKDAINVTRDYLQQVHQHVMKILARRYTAQIVGNASFDYVLTVPAIWSDAAKQRTEIAAKSAGLGIDGSTLQLLSEPESAAVYSLRTIENVLSTIRVKDKIIVCDAGGGTVDLISYELKQIRPILKVVECTKGTGDFCGSSFIDREFVKLCQSRMGPVYNKLSLTHQKRIVQSFEPCKLAFRDDPDCHTFYVGMPNSVPDMPDSRIVDGTFHISRHEMRAIFDPVVNQVLHLIAEQAQMAASDTGNVSHVLLVGGFGQSEYLFKRTEEWATPLQMQVLQPKEALVAVVKGAVLKGIEPAEGIMFKTMHIARRARRSYGIPTKAIFMEGRHLEKDAEYDPNTGTKLAGNQVKWFIKANQIVEDTETFCNTFRRIFTKLEPWEDILISSPSPDPPSRIDGDVKKHCIIRSDLSHLPLKSNFARERKGFLKSYYTAEYDLVMSLRNNNLSAVLQYHGKQYGIANIQFEVS